jgi:excisionase family DNA binding protein
MAKTGDSPPDKPLYMRIDEVARQFGYKSRRPVYDLIHAKKLAAVPLGPGGSLRIARAEFDRYCAQQEAEGAKRFGRQSA